MVVGSALGCGPSIRAEEAAEPVPQPLVYWSFDASTLQGDTLDAVVGDHDGTVSGARVHSNGQIGEALGFDGQDDHVTLSTFPDLTGPSTVATWVYMRRTPTPANPLFLARWDHPGQQRQFFLGTKNGSFAAGSSTDGSDERMIIPVDRAPIEELLMEWVHLAAVFDGEGLTLYRDGSPVAAAEFDDPSPLHTPSAPYPATMGRSFNAAPESILDGMLDEMAVWTEALTSEQIAQLHRRGDEGMALIE